MSVHILQGENPKLTTKQVQTESDNWGVATCLKAMRQFSVHYSLRFLRLSHEFFLSQNGSNKS